MGEQTLITIMDLVAVLILAMLPVLAMLAILVYQNARMNHLLKSVDRSLKLLPGVNRELKRVA